MNNSNNATCNDGIRDILKTILILQKESNIPANCLDTCDKRSLGDIPSICGYNTRPITIYMCGCCNTRLEMPTTRNPFDTETSPVFRIEKLDEDTEETIIKDLDRTYPSCQLFTDKYGKGQRKLYKVLSAYSLYNKEVGYVQGMGFLVAVFLMYMDEESSFFMLDSIMNKYNMKGTLIPGFPDLKKKILCFIKFRKKIFAQNL